MRRRKPRSSLLLFAFVAVLLLPRPTFAQTSTHDPSLELFDRGVAHLRANQLENAASAFRDSYRLSPRVSTMCNLALTYDRWGGVHRAQAIRAYRTCAEDDSEGRFRGHARERIRAIERDLALSGEDVERMEREADLELEGPDDSSGARSAEVDRQSSTELPIRDHAHVPTTSEHPTEDNARPVLWTGIGIGALGAVLVGTAVGLALDSQAQLEGLHRALGGSRTIVAGSAEESTLRRVIDEGTIATGLYIAGGTVIAAGIVMALVDWLLISQSRARTESKRESTVEQRSSTMMMLGGRF